MQRFLPIFIGFLGFCLGVAGWGMWWYPWSPAIATSPNIATIVFSSIMGLQIWVVVSTALKDAKYSSKFPWSQFSIFLLLLFVIQNLSPLWLKICIVLYFFLVAGFWLYYNHQYKSRKIHLADLNIDISLADYYKVYKKANSRDLLMARYTRKLAESPVPVESFYVPTRFGSTHVLTAGPVGAPPLILLHAAVGEALQWLPMLPQLVEHYRVYAPDIVGKGGRSMPVVLDAEGADYAYWLLDVMAGLGLQRARFAGEGGGAWLIFKLVQIAPTAIERTVLVGPTRIVPPSPSPESQKAHQQMKTNLNVATVRNYMQTLWLPGVDLPEKVVQNGFESISAHKRNLNFNIFPIISPLELVKLRVPTLVLLGRDVRVKETLAVRKELYKYLPQLQVNLLPGSSPLLAETQPEVVASEIARFMMVEAPALG